MSSFSTALRATPPSTTYRLVNSSVRGTFVRISWWRSFFASWKNVSGKCSVFVENFLQWQFVSTFWITSLLYSSFLEKYNWLYFLNFDLICYPWSNVHINNPCSPIIPQNYLCFLMLPSMMGRWTSLFVEASASRIHRRSTLRAVHFRRRAAAPQLSLRCWGSRALLAKIWLMNRAAQELPLWRWASRSIDLSLLVAARRRLLLLLLIATELVGRGRSGAVAGNALGSVRRLLILHRARARADARRRTPSSSRGWSADQQPDFSLTGCGAGNYASWRTFYALHSFFFVVYISEFFICLFVLFSF